MKKYLVFIMLLVATLFIGCEEETDPIIDDVVITKNKITGTVQKGPFIENSTVLVRELTADLLQTGKTFTATINSKGNFEVNSVQLISPYVWYEVTGKYYNEVTGEISDETIKLEGIADVSENSILNANIMTHLELPRVQYLVSHGAKFVDAKKQAQSEIMDLIEVEKLDIKNSELLDISKNSTDDAVLLALSAIFQGFRSTSELSLLIFYVRNDLTEDGVLDSTKYGDELASHARYLNEQTIRLNLQNKYTEMGVTANISTFNTILTNFIDQTEFDTKSLFDYGNDQNNLLNLSVNHYYINVINNITINLSENRYLSIRISKINYSTASWFAMIDNDNWTYSYNYNQRILDMTAIPGQLNELRFWFESTNSGEYLVEYFEMLSTTPTRTKTITVTVQ